MTETYLLQPNAQDEKLSASLEATDQKGEKVSIRVVTERALTLYLNAQEIVTIMTIGDYPDLLGIGYLRNQNMLPDSDRLLGVDYDDDLGVIVVRTDGQSDYEVKLKKKIRTSGCALGTIYGDVLEVFETIELSTSARLKTSWLYALTKIINTTPSLYLEAGAIHGCVLCSQNRPLIYMEDVGRHNAVDKIAGWMFQNNVSGGDKMLYTTGRLTTEMILKTVMMEIPVLVSRSGFTEAGVQMARDANLTLIGRARGERFLVLSGAERVEYDTQAREQV